MSRGYCDLCGAQNHGQTHTCNPASALLSPPVSDPKAYARLAARLAEVEAERDEAVKLAYERIEKQNVETGKRVDLIHEREAFRADRDRLAQELEDALGHLRDVAKRARSLRDVEAERDRLAQRGVELLEKVQLFAATGQRVTQERDEAIGHLRAVMNAERQAPPHRPQEDDEALAFLARFPREGDGDDS